MSRKNRQTHTQPQLLQSIWHWIPRCEFFHVQNAKLGGRIHLTNWGHETHTLLVKTSQIRLKFVNARSLSSPCHHQNPIPLTRPIPSIWYLVLVPPIRFNHRRFVCFKQKGLKMDCLSQKRVLSGKVQKYLWNFWEIWEI